MSARSAILHLLGDRAQRRLHVFRLHAGAFEPRRIRGDQRADGDLVARRDAQDRLGFRPVVADGHRFRRGHETMLGLRAERGGRHGDGKAAGEEQQVGQTLNHAEALEGVANEKGTGTMQCGARVPVSSTRALPSATRCRPAPRARDSRL